MDTVYVKESRTGIETSRALIELEISNSGLSDIRRMFMKNIYSYLAVGDSYNKKSEIAFLSGITSLKVGENKKLYLHIKHEISNNDELNNDWYKENIEKLMPYMEFEIILETTMGNSYLEKIQCGSGWDISMKNEGNTVTRSIGILEINVSEIL